MHTCEESPQPASEGLEWTWTSGTTYELQNVNASALNAGNGTPYCLVDPNDNGNNGTLMQVSTCTVSTKTGSTNTSKADVYWMLPAV